MRISRLAVETGIWPLYEVEHGAWKLTGASRKTRPVSEYLAAQGRFRHLLNGKDGSTVADIQRAVDGEWDRLMERCEMSNKAKPAQDTAAPEP